nr:ribonuclease H-like domain-containing protein [Tanacetum cinerariifolium]
MDRCWNRSNGSGVNNCGNKITKAFKNTKDTIIGLRTKQAGKGYLVIDGTERVGYNPSRTPVDTESKLGDGGTPVVDPTLYRSLAGSLHAEAEYRSVANAIAETCWIRNLLRELHTPLSYATIMYCDNVRAVYLSSNPVQHQRTKHIEIDIHFVWDMVATGHKNGVISLTVVSTDARSLRVSNPKKHETLESTWKTITDGRHIPLNRHLKKSDTFENYNQHELKLDYNAMKKLETFNDRTYCELASRKLRKEGSPSQDELNRRVEAFIKKFNDEMRLQRQESLQRYMDDE